ncbi:MAG: putative DNA-binding domain-containing protein, partial [Gammaproteobacteria bacterium]|nr:putative DNA-binding domain-containing protein [Gammaproteobacteria bacterium]
MSLQNLQAELAEHILTNEPTTENIFPSQHLLIYQNNRLSHLLNALEQTYTLILKLVGEDFFRAAAKAYINFYPARSGNLQDYGEYFGDFLSDYAPAQSLFYLSEIANFEWICHTLYFAADHAPFNVEVLNSFSIDEYQQLRFVLNPACCLMSLSIPI